VSSIICQMERQKIYEPFEGVIGRTQAESTPWWPERPHPGEKAPNVVLVLLDDTGFAQLGCFGSDMATPNIDRLAAEGLRYTNFHVTPLCSPTRAALLTGRDHHTVGMRSVSNFSSGYPHMRGHVSHHAATVAEVLRDEGYATFCVGKWHLCPMEDASAAGPFDHWPLQRGFDRFYGFMEGETDQFHPELVYDNHLVEPPATDGYHLTEDLVDESIRFVADHIADAPDQPFLLWLALGACHAPHQAPKDIIESYDPVFAEGWDVERERRLARQKALGIVPPDTKLPPPNDGVPPWESYAADDQRVFTRLQSAFAGMLEHADRHLARLVAFLEEAGVKDDTLILVLSDNGASQEGGPLGFVNAMGPYNMKFEPMPEKLANLDKIGGPDSHSNFPHGWAMASNTPLRRYKQNTHGGGIRDPLVIAWKNGLAARGETRGQFAHACDLTPTLLDLLGIGSPDVIGGVPQAPVEGVSFAASLTDPAAPAKASPQYFEMFGHRGLWKDGWKAVAFHPPGMAFDDDKWELYHLDADFSETQDLAEQEPERLKALVHEWWAQAERCNVLPLDDRFGPRFAENAQRHQGRRKQFVFHKGMGHLPGDCAPDVRSRSYFIEADVTLAEGEEGVLVAHGDATSGYSLFVRDGRLHHTLNIGGLRTTVSSDREIPAGRRKLGVRVIQGDGRTFTLTIDGAPAGEIKTHLGFLTFISWSGLDIGRDRGSAVGDYAEPFAFTGALRTVTVTMDADQDLDGEAVGQAEMARQ
jgi:arylsulfatase A-like enzyme